MVGGTKKGTLYTTEMELKYIPSGDSAFIIKAGDVISEEVNLVVRRLLARLEEENIPGVTDFIPSYNVSIRPATC